MKASERLREIAVELPDGTLDFRLDLRSLADEVEEMEGALREAAPCVETCLADARRYVDPDTNEYINAEDARSLSALSERIDAALKEDPS